MKNDWKSAEIVRNYFEIIQKVQLVIWVNNPSENLLAENVESINANCIE